MAPFAGLVEELVRASLTDGQAYEKLALLCRVAPHRLSGSQGADRAVEWARETMIRDGLENVRLEPVLVPCWERGDTAQLEILEPPMPSGEGELRILALGGSVGTPGEGIVAGVVEVTSFEELANLGGAARGKLVLFNRPMDPALVNTFAAYGGSVGQRGQGAIEAARVGAVGALVRSMTTLRDDSPHTGAMHYEEGVDKVPSVAVSTLGAEKLSGLLRDHPGRVRMRLRLDCRTLPDRPSANVVGEIRGREKPEEIVLIGGHLDAWDVGEGAHDDGSGCCQVLEAARLLLASGLRPRRTLRVVLFLNEENGLRGAQAYYETHLEELPLHVMALESDRGGFTPRGFTTDGNPRAAAMLAAASSLLSSIGCSDMLPGSGGADVSPLRRKGVVTVGLYPDCQRYFDVHHSENDILAAVNERELELGAVAIAALAYVVADLPERLPPNEVTDGESR
jgi:hypothetical protein